MTTQFRATFTTPFDQYADREGQTFRILREITEPDATHDEEVLPMYAIEFGDGTQIEAWPEEVCITTLSDHLTALSGASTADQARDLAIDLQHWESGESLAYSELAEIQQALESLTERFPTLTDEFRENGLI